MSSIPILPYNPNLTGLATYVPDIPFAQFGEKTLRLQLLKPFWSSPQARCPLIVFVQGSAWTNPNPYHQIPQLSAFAQAGFVVASVTHRSREEAPFPAFLQDVKTAIRFLRAHADEHGIDPERVGIWGTSSGGNMALLAGLTGEEYGTEDYAEQSSRVQAVADCFGPADIRALIDQNFPEAWNAPGNPMEELSGKPMAESVAVFDAMSPTLLIRPGMDLPPFLLLHGDADEAVPFEQSEQCYRTLLDHGYRAALYRVPGAPHEQGFWSQDLLSVILRFLQETLQADTKENEGM
ncbi:MAG TPA: alpha/beta hydrolase [Clostridia bacterium]|nr:alpha/beta hydrolase [Clostridia bacterium]